MNVSANAYGSEQCVAASTVRPRCRIGYEESPPFTLVMLVFVAAMSGGAYVSCAFNSIAFGWMAGVGILAALGAAIDHLFAGAAALERRLDARSRARHHAVRKSVAKCGLAPQPREWPGATAREWTSVSAYRRHPQYATNARQSTR